ncbi:hypothetical protein GCM10009122_49910 [Fulvivirga kasyanovii]|uniref:Uncharacterized protein n=1 Tax=Fulvivirga kasyanovii TaxID=396812 RepID=A0ABW9RLI1_9BACT|nr:hypothetical protein [Fulvivirga kasyanovii]MTI24228.1 hypothetical protein [Fulvivirga kasyanovii]
MDAHLTSYDFPKGNPGPFDMQFQGNYFAIANGYSNLGSKYNDFSFTNLDENIQMGYKLIIVCYRLALIEGGKATKSWNYYGKLKEEKYSGMFHLSAMSPVNRYMPEWDRTIRTLSIYKPDATNGSLEASTWSDYNECKQYAINISEASSNKFLLSLILETHSWH